MSKIYYGDRSSGGSLKHYRTKGSKNGYSKNPNYKAVGQKAVGRLVNGRYVYDDYNVARSNYYGQQNNWQQRATQTRATNEAYDKFAQGRTSNIGVMAMKQKEQQALDNDLNKRHGDGKGGMRWDNSYANASARVASGVRVNTPGRVQVASEQSKKDKAAAKARAAREDAISKGSKNDWQHMGNMHRAASESWQAASQRRVNAIAPITQKSMSSIDTDLRKRYADNNGQLKMDRSYANALNSKNRKHSEDLMKNTKSAMSSSDPRYTLSDTQKEVYNKAVDSASAAAKKRGLNVDKYDSAIRRGANAGLRYTLSKPEEARAIGLAKQKAKEADPQAMKEEQKRIKAGEKARAKRESKRKRQALINKIKSKIKNFFS